jgi:TolA-binding protein
MNRKFTPSAYHQIIENTDSVSPKLLKKYLEGKLSEKEAHQVEKQLINCSFSAEALEGYQQNRGKAIDPLEIAKKLAQDIERYNRERGFGDSLPTLSNWLRLGSVAAAGLFLVGFVGLIYWNMQGIVYKAEQQTAANALKQSTQAQEAPLLADVPTQAEETAAEAQNEPESPQKEAEQIAQAEPTQSEAQQAQRAAAQTPTMIETNDFSVEKKEKNKDQVPAKDAPLKNPEKFTLTQAYQFYQRGEFAAASQLFDFFLTKNPNNAELLFHAAHAHFLNQNQSRAATLFEQLLMQKADLEVKRVEESRYYLALSYAALGKKEQARQILQDLAAKKGNFSAKAQQKLNDL